MSLIRRLTEPAVGALLRAMGLIDYMRGLSRTLAEFA